MRVISQDGTTDVPYENVVLYQDEKEIMCIFSGIYIGRKLAQYSTTEKTEKAMEMLREAYLSRMELDGGYDAVNGCYVQPNYWVLPKVFQFPQDDEIEV